MKKVREAEVDLTPRCGSCETTLTYSSCMECYQRLPTSKGAIIYCCGPLEETWHYCEPCHSYLENLKCPECSGKHIDRYAKDTKEGVMIVNTCQDCKNIWETKRGIK